MKNYYLSDIWTSIYLSKLLRQPIRILPAAVTEKMIMASLLSQ